MRGIRHLTPSLLALPAHRETGRLALRMLTARAAAVVLQNISQVDTFKATWLQDYCKLVGAGGADTMGSLGHRLNGRHSQAEYSSAGISLLDQLAQMHPEEASVATCSVSCGRWPCCTTISLQHTGQQRQCPTGCMPCDRKAVAVVHHHNLVRSAYLCLPMDKT